MTFCDPPKYKISAVLLLLSLLCMFHSAPLNAQEQVYKDSLSFKTPQELKQGVYRSTPEIAVIYEQALLQQYKKPIDKATIYLELGKEFYYEESAYDKSVYYFERGIEYASMDKNPKLLARLYFLLGNAELISWNNENALHCLLYTSPSPRD